MRKPCGTWICRQFVERCGGTSGSPSMTICWGCGSEGPMADYYNEHGLGNADDESDGAED